MTRNLFVFAGIFCLIFGLQLIFVPDFIAKTFLVDSTLTAGVAAVLRGYGILLSCLGISLFIARNSVPSTAKTGLLLIIVIGGIVGIINTVYMLVKGVGTNNNWFIVALLAIEAIWGLMIFARKQHV